MSLNIVELDKFLFNGDYGLNKIGIGDKLSSERLLNFAVKYRFSHILQRSSTDHEKQYLTSRIMLEQPDLFFKHPLSSILDPENIKASNEKKLSLFEIKFKTAQEKNMGLEAVVDKLQKTIKDQILLSDIKLAADELMCNALFNAPYIVDRELPDKSKSRKVKNAQLFIGATPGELVIGCEDNYGSLDVVKLLARVRDCFSRSVGAGISNLGNYGAGLGTFMIFSVCSSMYFAVDKNEHTLVCCSIQLRPRRERYRAFSKTLHLIVP